MKANGSVPLAVSIERQCAVQRLELQICPCVHHHGCDESDGPKGLNQTLDSNQNIEQITNHKQPT